MDTSSRYPRLLQPPKGSFFLFGLRGAGKSTWAREHFPEALRIDLLDEDRYQRLLADPGLFGDLLRRLPAGSRVIVDEVQRLPSLLNEVHRFIEERRLRFALLGSSARKLKTAGTNLLAGRAVWRTLHPFVPSELGDDFDLDSALRFGTIPLVWMAEDRRERLEAYAQLYLREEIKAEALVRNLPGFARFLPVAALFHGQVISVAAIARDAGTARTTVNGYLEILEDTLVATRLRAFEGRLRVRERRHPKLYWTDPGLVRAMKRQLGPLAVEERGALFEGWILNVLRAHATVSELFDEIFYWAPAAARGVEVDFLLQRGREFLAIEVKSSKHASARELAGLRAIEALPKLARRVLVYLGREERRSEDSIEIWPQARLLDAIADDVLWP
jgi:predicted AAA+ superfamily ATPase